MMDRNDLNFEDFLASVDPAYHEFVTQKHTFLLENGCGMKMDLAKNGYLVSYSDTCKRVLLNFVFRKSGLVTRIYGDHVNRYNDFLETLPDGMVKAIEKAMVCKRLIDMKKCNSRCRMGYDFTLKGARWQKCQYNCFIFPVNEENVPFINDFLMREWNARAEV